MKRKIIVLFLLMVINVTIFSQAVEIKENLVYSILYSTGVEYGPAFCREDSDTVFLLSGQTHYLTVRKTMVSYDPGQGTYKMEPEHLDLALTGYLELLDNSGQYIKLDPQKYTYYNNKI